mmetsp:Transcript_25580/g.41983  ORF Transcript_25580/g.41983 Transcript_25580/m.41983 type:complete len:461 (+) Transcript_25580:117-1499(+)
MKIIQKYTLTTLSVIARNPTFVSSFATKPLLPALTTTTTTSSHLPFFHRSFALSMTQRKSSSTSNKATRACPSVPTHLKGVFCGSGSDAMNDTRITNAILNLVNKPPQETNVLYLGTATYDIEGFFIRQTQRFVEAGCHVEALKVAGVDTTSADEQWLSSLSPQERIRYYEEKIDNADVLVVGGGNTLFALDRWRKLGLVPALRRAGERGAVLTGGSAGAICWFDGGHSNSADPSTYKSIRVKKFANRSPDEIVDEIYSYKSDSSTDADSDSDDEDTDADMSSSDEEMSDSDDEGESKNNNKKTSKPWEYFRVSALGFFPGLVSPHLDRVQSNGVLRARDFDECLLQHPGENGIGIDHFAALIVDGPNFEVLSLTDKEGTVKKVDDNTFEFVEDGSGDPGVWIKQAVNGKVVSRVCPPRGQLKDILRVASTIVEDEEATRQCRMANPDDGWVPPTPAIRQ